MTTPIRRTLATVLAISLSFAGMAQAAPVVVAAPALIGTEQAAAAQPGGGRALAAG